MGHEAKYKIKRWSATKKILSATGMLNKQLLNRKVWTKEINLQDVKCDHTYVNCNHTNMCKTVLWMFPLSLNTSFGTICSGFLMWRQESSRRQINQTNTFNYTWRLFSIIREKETLQKVSVQWRRAGFLQNCEKANLIDLIEIQSSGSLSIFTSGCNTGNLINGNYLE